VLIQTLHVLTSFKSKKKKTKSSKRNLLKNFDEFCDCSRNRKKRQGASCSRLFAVKVSQMSSLMIIFFLVNAVVVKSDLTFTLD
jgi:hypothetical protein